MLLDRDVGADLYSGCRASPGFLRDASDGAEVPKMSLGGVGGRGLFSAVAISERVMRSRSGSALVGRLAVAELASPLGPAFVVCFALYAARLFWHVTNSLPLRATSLLALSNFTLSLPASCLASVSNALVVFKAALVACNVFSSVVNLKLSTG